MNDYTSHLADAPHTQLVFNALDEHPDSLLHLSAQRGHLQLLWKREATDLDRQALGFSEVCDEALKIIDQDLQNDSTSSGRG